MGLTNEYVLGMVDSPRSPTKLRDQLDLDFPGGRFVSGQIERTDVDYVGQLISGLFYVDSYINRMNIPVERRNGRHVQFKLNEAAFEKTFKTKLGKTGKVVCASLYPTRDKAWKVEKDILENNGASREKDPSQYFFNIRKILIDASLSDTAIQAMWAIQLVRMVNWVNAGERYD